MSRRRFLGSLEEGVDFATSGRRGLQEAGSREPGRLCSMGQWDATRLEPLDSAQSSGAARLAQDIHTSPRPPARPKPLQVTAQERAVATWDARQHIYSPSRRKREVGGWRPRKNSRPVWPEPSREQAGSRWGPGGARRGSTGGPWALSTQAAGQRQHSDPDRASESQGSRQDTECSPLAVTLAASHWEGPAGRGRCQGSWGDLRIWGGSPWFRPLSCGVHSGAKPGLAQAWRGLRMGLLQVPRTFQVGTSGRLKGVG